MKKKPQLYIKNEKGRYEPYKEPEIVDRNVYKKVGNKYEPIGIRFGDNYLNDGLWLVKSKESSREIASIEHYACRWGLFRLGDIPRLDLNLIGTAKEIHDTIDKYLYQKYGFTVDNIPHKDLADELTEIIMNFKKD